VTDHGKDHAWSALFKALEGKLPEVSVQVFSGRSSSYRWVTGVFESLASWENLEETDRFYGIIVTDDNEVQTWVPYEAIQAVSLG